MNYWHDIESGTQDKINVIIEIPRGGRNKYEIDKATGLIALDRPLHTAQDYPCNYGFSPRTLWDDNDALDVIVLATFDIVPGILVRVRPVGIMRMIDDGESDDKLIGVPVGDPRFENIKDIGDINEHTLRELSHFFRTYKDLQDKKVEITGFKGVKEAKEAFERSRKLYDEKYEK